MTRGPHYEGEPWSNDDDEDPRSELRAAFQRRVDRGRYDELLTPQLRTLMQAGAAIHGMDEELGAIRFALKKLIAEEQDANKLAAGIARLTSASVQAMKLGQVLGDATDASLADLINEILADLDDTASG